MVRSDQKMMSPRQYLVEEERVVDLADQRRVLIRPARADDAMGLKDLFHALSAQDVYTRFFRRMTSLSYEDAQRLCNVDFDRDVAFVAVEGPRENENIIGTGAYFLNPTTNYAEVAYMSRPPGRVAASASPCRSDCANSHKPVASKGSSPRFYPQTQR